MKHVAAGAVLPLLFLNTLLLTAIYRNGLTITYKKDNVLLLRPAVSSSGESALLGSNLALDE